MNCRQNWNRVKSRKNSRLLPDTKENRIGSPNILGEKLCGGALWGSKSNRQKIITKMKGQMCSREQNLPFFHIVPYACNYQSQRKETICNMIQHNYRKYLILLTIQLWSQMSLRPALL